MDEAEVTAIERKDVSATAEAPRDHRRRLDDFRLDRMAGPLEAHDNGGMASVHESERRSLSVQDRHPVLLVADAVTQDVEVDGVGFVEPQKDHVADATLVAIPHVGGHPPGTALGKQATVFETRNRKRGRVRAERLVLDELKVGYFEVAGERNEVIL